MIQVLVSPTSNVELIVTQSVLRRSNPFNEPLALRVTLQHLLSTTVRIVAQRQHPLRRAWLQFTAQIRLILAG